MPAGPSRDIQLLSRWTMPRHSTARSGLSLTAMSLRYASFLYVYTQSTA